MSCVEISTAMCCSRRDSREQVDHLLLAADVQVRERLVEEQQAADG